MSWLPIVEENPVHLALLSFYVWYCFKIAIPLVMGGGNFSMGDGTFAESVNFS